MSVDNKTKSLPQKLEETKLELKKVRWPTKKEAFRYTVIVLLMVIFFSIFLYLADSVLGFIITKLVSL